MLSKIFLHELKNEKENFTITFDDGVLTSLKIRKRAFLSDYGSWCIYS